MASDMSAPKIWFRTKWEIVELIISLPVFTYIYLNKKQVNIVISFKSDKKLKQY